MTIRNLDRILNPRSVAIFGAGPDDSSVGGAILRNIQDGPFEGPVYAVSPRHDSIRGKPVFRDVAALPEAPDLAIIATPQPSVAPLVAALGDRGTRGVVVISAGFEGDAQAPARAELLDAARPNLVRVVGPNCFGVLSPARGLQASFARSHARPGPIAFVAQSGAVIAAMLGWARPRGIGFSHVVSLGDMLDVDFGDMLDYLALDPATEAVLLYVESITYPRKFMSAARAAARVKPVIVVKAGRHAQSAEAARSHTGAVAGPDGVYDAIFARSGLVRARNLQDMFDIAAMLSTACRPRGDRLAVVTNGGGVGVLAADELLDAGGTLSRLSPDTLDRLNQALPAHWSHGNPIDLIGDADAARYSAAVSAVLGDSEVDAVLVMHCPTKLQDPLAVASSVAQASVQSQKPVIGCWLGDALTDAVRHALDAGKISVFATPDEAVRGFMHNVAYVRRRELLMQTPALPDEIPAANVASARRIITNIRDAGWLSAIDVRTLLELYGITCNRAIFAPTPQAVVAAARTIGGPVALKISSPDIIHKSDVGGVVLNIANPDLAGQAAASMLAAVAAAVPTARISGIVVEEMVTRPGARDLFLGVTTDNAFGPVIAFGQGGTAVEVIGDVALGLPPLNDVLAEGLIAATRVSKVMRGYRNVPAADRQRVVSALLALSQLITDHPQITDVDINPLLSNERGAIAVDARIRIDVAQQDSRLIISPYPRELEETISLNGGATLFVRPIRPQDESAFTAMIEQLDRSDIRFRFFELMRHVGHELAARLTQINYDREMGLAALPNAAPGPMWGAAHLFADPDMTTAEFAVVVHPAHRNRGIATALLRKLILFAAKRGIGSIWGDVLSDNHRMLELCAAMGFKPMALQPDSKVVRLAIDPRAAAVG